MHGKTRSFHITIVYDGEHSGELRAFVRRNGQLLVRHDDLPLMDVRDALDDMLQVVRDDLLVLGLLRKD